MRWLWAYGLSALFLLGEHYPAYAFNYWQALPALPEYPKDNPPSVEMRELGKQLFFDPRMSNSGRTACIRCHNILSSGADGHAFSVGESGQPTRRSAPSLWNVAYQTVYFWDGRAQSLELCILEHLVDPDIMAIDPQVMRMRLQKISAYRASFNRLFGEVTHAVVAKSLATYVRSLITPDSPFDRYIRGDRQALSQAQLRGKELFGQIECLGCHFGVNFSGPAPGPALTMGQGFYELFPVFRGDIYNKRLNLGADLGRYHVTGDPMHKMMWRVPSLRNIALSAPYFHNGSAKSLQQAVATMAATQRDRDLNNNEIELLVEFLNSLTGIRPKQTLPHLPDTPNLSIP